MKLKKLLMIGVFGILLGLGLHSLPAMAQFDSAKKLACEGLEFDASSSDQCDESQNEKVDNTVAAVINIASLIVGVVAVIMVVVGGLKYITSQGDANGTSSAKNTVLYAIVGLIIVALAQVIVRFVVNRATTDPVEAPPAQSEPVDLNQDGPR